MAIELVERNILLGGEPGAGKSAALSVLLAAAALDPNARLWLFDGKLVELAAWAPVAQRVAGPDGEQALELLRELRAEMDERYRELLARGLRKIRREDGLPLHLVVCDELAFYLTLPDKDQRKEFAELLRDLVARGRAAGVIVCAATQKPGTDIGAGLRCATCSASGWRCAARPRRPRTRSSGRAGPPTARTRRRSPARSAASATCWPRASGRCGCAATTSTTTPSRAIAERAAARRTDEWLEEGGSA